MSLRFAMLTTFYPPYSFGGDAIGIQRLARALVARGHEVTVVHDEDAYLALADGKEPAAERGDDGVERIGLRSGAGMIGPLLTQQTGRALLTRGRIERLLAERDPHVVNFHNMSLVGGPDGLRLGSGVKVYMAHEHWLVCPMHVLWRHNREPCTGRQCVRCSLHFRRPPQVWRHTGLLERRLDDVHAFIAMSEFSAAKHREMGFPRQMEVLPYFLADNPPAAGPSPHPRPYFLAVARLERIKGIDTIIPAMRRHPGADLLIAGDGTERDRLMKMAQGMTNVRLLGRVPVDDLAQLYRHAIALIMPSAGFETFGITLIEAFRQGTPAIARRMGPFPEIVRRGGGELFGSSDEMLAAMRRLQDDPAHRDLLGKQARRAFEETWTEEAVMPRYLDIVRRAAAVAGRSDAMSALEPEEMLA